MTAIGIWLALLSTAASAQVHSRPPLARIAPQREILHGVALTDPYPWLDDLASEETRAWLQEQNAHSEAALGRIPGRHILRDRLARLAVHDSVSAPTIAGGKFFFEKRSAGGGRPLLCMREKPDGPDVVLIDPSSVSPDPSVAVQFFSIAQDGRRIAYSVREGGRDEVAIRFLDIALSRTLPFSLPTGLYSRLVFEPSGDGFYFVRRSRSEGSRLYRHSLKDGAERLLFGQDTTPDQFVSADLSSDGRILLIAVQHGWARSELFFLDLEHGGPVRPLITGIDALFFPTWSGPHSLIVQTSWKAPNRRLIAIDLLHPGQDHWTEVVPESASVIQDFDVIGGALWVGYLKDVHSEIRRFPLTGGPSAVVPLPGIGMARLRGEWDHPVGVLTYTSFTEPSAVYLFHTEKGSRDLWFRPDIPLDNTALETRQVWFQSKDGTRVPMFLVHKKGLRRDRNRPVLLYGYGGFNVPQTPGFRPTAVAWAEQGGVFALANIRGGGEFGERWHRGGMLANKQNAFDDFIAAAEWLIRSGYTTPSRLAIQGASNGGLLMGAALTQRPDLFRAVLCEYPDLDMIRYYRYTGNNNPPALLEYGDASKPAEFAFLRRYSPYENVRPKTSYPAVLLVTGDGDTRVPPQQAIKMAAKLQAASTSGRPVLLSFNFKSGHAGGRSIEQAIDAIAARLAFLLDQLGVAPQ
ncbi:MAG: prolyl oligopeptidase family serine peptidase [Bryobacteraceae bacterium]